MDAQKQQIVQRLKEANNILVTVKRDPTIDHLSACIGLTLLLNEMNKHGTAVFSGAVPSVLEFLQPEKTIEVNTDSLRDFIISLDKSKADKLRYKVEDKVVKIFITPYKTSITDHDLEFSQGDFNVDVVVALGVHEQSELDEAITAHGRILHDATVMSINTTQGENLGTINWQDATASSLCEMIAGLSDSLAKDKVDNQIATAYLTGIVSETERFSNAKTSPKTMSVSAKLLTAGANQELVATRLSAPVALPEPETPPADATSDDDADDSQDDERPRDSGPDDQPPAPPRSNDGSLVIDHTGDSTAADEQPAPPPDATPDQPPAPPQSETAKPEPDASADTSDAPVESSAESAEDTAFGSVMPGTEIAPVDEPTSDIAVADQAASDADVLREARKAKQRDKASAEQQAAAEEEAAEQEAEDILRHQQIKIDESGHVRSIETEHRAFLGDPSASADVMPSAEDEKPAGSPFASEGTKFVLHPPTMGGVLTANSRPEQLDPTTDPLSMTHPQATTLEHGQKTTKPVGLPPRPAVPLDALARPAEATRESAHKTLADIERDTHSPHLQQSAPAGLAQLSDDPAGTPNQPLDMPLPVPARSVPAASVSAAPAVSSATPPPVPPPFMGPAS